MCSTLDIMDDEVITYHIVYTYIIHSLEIENIIRKYILEKKLDRFFSLNHKSVEIIK